MFQFLESLNIFQLILIAFVCGMGWGCGQSIMAALCRSVSRFLDTRRQMKGSV